jgi:D-alanine transaminase
MSRIAYVNGRYLPHRAARVHIEDRGFQFADGVYEVVAIRDGKLIDEGLHLGRLQRSMRELSIAPPMSDRALRLVMREVIRRNGVHHGIIYLQVTRGAAPRDFPFPIGARPSLVMTARRSGPIEPRLLTEGASVITTPDIRWGRPDIKSVALLPNALAKQKAKEAGAYEAWQIDRDGNVTEGTSSNAWIVSREGEVVTRQADTSILNGITRIGLKHLLDREGLRLVERPFSLAEAKTASEAFLTSSSNFVVPVVRIDRDAVGDGRPGPVTRKLRDYYTAYAAHGGQDG